MTQVASVLDLIGATRSIEMTVPGGRIVAKAEYLQPGGSVKDRPARSALERARARGELQPGQTVVEMTSGNMGAGLAVVCGALAHPFVAVMSAGNSVERARMIRGLGGEVILVPQTDGTPGCVTGGDIAAADLRARALARERAAFYVDQFNNDDCFAAHETTTGPELCSAYARIDAFVACVGSGATLIGTLRALQRRDPGVLGVAVEPAGAAILAGETVTKTRHVLQGSGYGVVPPRWEPHLVDTFATVSDDDATAARAELGRAGIYVGFTSGANIVAARRLLAGGGLRPGATVATVLCDSGLKY